MPTLFKQSMLVALVLVAAMISPLLFNIVLVSLTLYAMLGPAQIVKAVALSIVIKYLNPVLGSYNSISGLLFWLLLILIGCRALPLVRSHHLKIVITIWSFAAVAALLSYISSPAVTVSMLKITTFAWVVPAVVIAFLALSVPELARVQQWFKAFALAAVGLSALTLLRPGIAFALVPGSLQGIFNHPQSLGIFMAPIAAWMIAGFIVMRGKATPKEIAIGLLVTLVMLLSLARTAAVAAVIGILIACVIPLVTTFRSNDRAGIGRIAGAVLIGVLGIALVSVLTDQVGVAVNEFVLKRGNADVATSFYESRGWGILSQWRNFLERPLLGNGFGVYADGKFPTGIVEVFGIPISAPVEKGFAPTAVLEETGILGGCLFVLVIFHLAKEAHKNTDLRWVAAFWAAVMVNIGEAVILSPGGIGLYVWLVIGLCAASGRCNAILTTEEPAANEQEYELARYPNLMR
jgi:hypothetical protein